MQKRVTKSVIVGADPATVYGLWSDFENFPRFMKFIKEVRKGSEGTSHWVMEGPLGREVEWTAETTRAEPNQRIGWNTKDRQGLTTSGEVVFAPLPGGQTQVEATVQYVPPAGVLGEAIARLFANPETRLEEDLANFKAYAEGKPNRMDR
jgi:uncharacterized membrane protein